MTKEVGTGMQTDMKRIVGSGSGAVSRSRPRDNSVENDSEQLIENSSM